MHGQYPPRTPGLESVEDTGSSRDICLIFKGLALLLWPDAASSGVAKAPSPVKLWSQISLPSPVCTLSQRD